MSHSRGKNFDAHGNFLGGETLRSFREEILAEPFVAPISMDPNAPDSISERDMFNSLANLVDDLFSDSTPAELEAIRECIHEALLNRES